MLSEEARRDCHTAAVAYAAAGMSLIPIKPGSDKAPALERGHAVLARKRPPVNKELDDWFRDHSNGIAALCGKISGNLECLDFDKPDLAMEWFKLASAQLVGLSEMLAWVKTPSGGWHCWYRSAELIGCNTKLAYDPAHKTMIETRGEGGYALLPGGDAAAHHLNKPYTWVEGRLLTNLAVIEASARDTMLGWARSFTRLAEQATLYRGQEADPCPADELRPGDDYNLRGPDWQDILTPHGWKEVGKGGGQVRYWQRPDKIGHGKSATTGCKAKDGTVLFFPFSSNASPFESGKGYSKFRTFAILNHEGSQSKAASVLRAQGYGGKRAAIPEGPKPKPAPAPTTALGAAAAQAHTAGWEPIILTASKVQRKPIEWLWQDWLPLGKLALVSGDMDLGKSTMLIDLAARITRGWAMPDESMPCLTGDVIMLTAEDDEEDTLEPRLAAAGADLDRVHFVSYLKRSNVKLEEPFAIPDHADILESIVQRTHAALIIFDPLVAFLANGVDENKNGPVRRAIRPLYQLCKRQRCSAIGLRHLNKGGGTKAKYRGGGTVGLGAACRSELMVVADPDVPPNTAGSVLAWVKGNLTGNRPSSLRFGFDRSEIEGIARIGWKGTSSLSASELLEAEVSSYEERSTIEEAIDFLRDFLADEPRLKKDVIKAGREQGISRATIDRARARIGIIVQKAPLQDGKFVGNEWKLKTELSREDLI